MLQVTVSGNYELTQTRDRDSIEVIFIKTYLHMNRRCVTLILALVHT